MLFEPLEARPEFCTSTSDWVERDRLPCFEGLNRMHDRVEVENVDALRSLTFEDRTNLGLEQAQLPRVYRAGAIDGDRNLTYTFPHHSGQVKPGPDVAAVGTHPAIVRRCGFGPGPAQQFPPIDGRVGRPIERAFDAGGYFASLFGKRDRLVDGDAPLPSLLLSRRSFLVSHGRIQHLSYPAFCLGG